MKRNRFIKMLMSKRIERNVSNKLADFYTWKNIEKFIAYVSHMLSSAKITAAYKTYQAIVQGVCEYARSNDIPIEDVIDMFDNIEELQNRKNCK